MKVIDLLNKIANGEEVPEKFKFAGQIFKKQGRYIEDEDGDSIFESMFTDFSNINDEVEIIEEDKKIKKLPYYDYKEINLEKNRDKFIEKLLEKHDKRLNDYHEKINEILDYINGGTNGE